jgi:hypothetical protein
MVLPQLILSLALVASGGLWAYSTLLVFFIYLEETDSFYFYPMRMALDRFVEAMGLGWLKPLHGLQLSQRRSLSYCLFGLVSLGVAFLLWLTE